MYKLCVFVFLVGFFGNILCLEIGSQCTVGNVTGVCKSILECQYAIAIVTDLQKKPPMCFWQETTRIVCCPDNNDSLHKYGIFSRYFEGSDQGVLTSHNMTCRNDGQEQFLCCHNMPDQAVVPEPKGCPPLPAPKLKAKPHFAWTKCLEYQRYCDVCVGYSGNYKRNNQCRVSNTRLLEGVEASPKEFPHMAVLGCRNKVNAKDADIIWIGGGSLISEKFILTAAHVLVDNKYGLIRYALLGALNKTDIKSGLLCNVIRTIPHKGYDKAGKQHDIALVQLNERVKFNEFIRPACLPVPGREVQDTDRIVAGWGINESGKTSDLLLTATVSLVEDPEYCPKKFDDYFPETMICATGNVGKSNKPTDTCQGDSGGPLMALITNLNNSYSVEGVVSYGPKCGKGASVYTDVTKYLNWITENVWPNEGK